MNEEEFDQLIERTRAILQEFSPDSVLDFDMLLNLIEDKDDRPFNPATDMRIDDIALRTFCRVQRRIIQIGQEAGMNSDPVTLSFLMGLQLGHRVAHEQVGRTA